MQPTTHNMYEMQKKLSIFITNNKLKQNQQNWPPSPTEEQYYPLVLACISPAETSTYGNQHPVFSCIEQPK